jgi:hypothetical protein
MIYSFMGDAIYGITEDRPQKYKMMVSMEKQRKRTPAIFLTEALFL